MAIPSVCVNSSDKPYEWPIIPLDQETVRTVSVVIKDRNGDPLTLDSTVNTVILHIKERIDDTDYYLTKSCTINHDSSLTIDFNDTEVNRAGSFIGEFLVTITVTKEIIGRYRCYLDVTPNMTTDQGQRDPLTIPEIRMAIKDRVPGDNFLLDDLEWTDNEIMFAIRRPIDYWNDMPPDVSQFTAGAYSPARFPYRYYWMEGIVGELLRMAALNLTRNRMPVQAGGIQTDDKIRADAYLKISEEFLQRYREWVVQKKYEINIHNCWGFTQLVTRRRYVIT